MPLDVALDDAGITFAGALASWANVQRVTRVDRWTLAIQGEDRELRLGPGKRETLDALEAELRRRMPAPASPRDPVTANR